MSDGTKVQIVAIIGSLSLLVIVIDLVRRRRLKEEYSVLWVFTAVCLLTLAAWFDLLDWLTTAIGGVAPSSTIFFFSLLFVFCMLLHFSVRVSSLERRLTALVQEIGIMSVRPPGEEAQLPPGPEGAPAPSEQREPQPATRAD